MYSRIHIRIRHPVFAIRIVFVTWCRPIRSSPKIYHVLKYKKDLVTSVNGRLNRRLTPCSGLGDNSLQVEWKCVKK